MSENKSDSNNTQRRLYRSQAGRVIGGVASGIAKYFDIDVIIVRILFIFAVFLGGMGVPAYIIGWVIIPKEDTGVEPAREKSNQSTLIWGALFIIFGFIVLGRQFYWWDYDNFYYDWHWHHPWAFFGMNFNFLIPVVLILLGLYYIVKTKKNKESLEESPKQNSGEKNMEKKLTRSVDEKMVAGVCGGLAKYLNIDPSVVRIAFALLTIGSGFFTGLIVYVAMIFIVPEEGTEKKTEVKQPEAKQSEKAATSTQTVTTSTSTKSSSSKPRTTKAKTKPKTPSKSTKPKDDDKQESE